MNNVVELAIKGFIEELLKKKNIEYHSASNTNYWVVYVDDILELANKYGIELEDYY